MGNEFVLTCNNYRIYPRESVHFVSLMHRRGWLWLENEDSIMAVSAWTTWGRKDEPDQTLFRSWKEVPGGESP